MQSLPKVKVKSLGEVIVNAIEKFLEGLFDPITDVIEQNAADLIRLIVGTRHPNSVFNPPTNGPWPNIYEYYWETTVPLALLLWGVAIGLVIFFETTSYLFSSYHRTMLKKRAFSGLLGILAWWWIASISLRFTDALTGVITPALSDVTLFETLSFGAMGLLGLVLTLFADFILFVLLALVYLMRELALYLFVLMMPILIALWVPGVGPFTFVSRFVSRLAGFYVPFLFMTVPVAILFRVGELLGLSFGLSMAGFGAWLVALVIPLVALFVPIVLFWQAGAVYLVADRTSRRLSSQRAGDRIARTRDRAADTRHGSQNFSRGLRGEPAMRQDGQYVIDSGQSRAHAAGSRLRSSVVTPLSEFNEGRRGGGSDGGGGVGSAPADPLAYTGPTRSRNDSFETLRERSATNRTTRSRLPGRTDEPTDSDNFR
jgi:hypothetical protein